MKGKREGYHTKYYESGQILSKAKFKENKLNGKYIEFYLNGNLLTEKFYKNGYLQGKSRDYYSMGQLLSENSSQKVLFKANKLIIIKMDK